MRFFSGATGTTLGTHYGNLAGSSGVPPQFGFSLSSADLDGNGDLELLVGAPAHSPPGLSNAGTVFAYDIGGVSGISEETNLQPGIFKLEQNYPNPFNPKTEIGFSVPAEGRVANQGFVSLKVHDVLGREVAVLVNEVKPPGAYTVEWNANGFAGGVYFCQLRSGGFSAVRKMLLAK
jgi:hypothetical protein